VYSITYGLFSLQRVSSGVSSEDTLPVTTTVSAGELLLLQLSYLKFNVFEVPTSGDLLLSSVYSHYGTRQWWDLHPHYKVCTPCACYAV